MTKRILSIVLLIALLLGTLPYSAYAVEVQENSMVNTKDISASKEDSVEPKGSTPPSRAIVIIPGMLGSTLKNASTNVTVWLDIINCGQLELNEDGTSKNSNIVPFNDHSGANSVYAPLYNDLVTSYASYSDICDVIFFPYDFRLNNSDTAIKLAAAVADYSEVVIIAHSMGGLVASKFLANSAANRAKTVALITIGTPFLGSAKCINAMETGELIVIPGTNIPLFNPIVKKVSNNSYAAYQLLPTTNYHTYTGQRALYVNSSQITNCYTALANTAWGKTSNATTKPMFQAAVNFHSSLGTGSNHIIFTSGVPVYTLAGSGLATIDRVSMDSNYNITYLHISANGDGTVLAKSAGHGTPYKTFYSSESVDSVEHSELMSNPDVTDEIKQIIFTETGMRAAGWTPASINSQTYTITSEDAAPILNARGWVVGQDNKRIVIVADCADELLYNGSQIIEHNEKIYDSDGHFLGNVWTLGNTNRKQYLLMNGTYQVNSTGHVLIEFMDSGYYDAAFEYSLEDANGIISIFGYGITPIGSVNGNVESPYIHSQESLIERNRD